jgi:hypothetical protein
MKRRLISRLRITQQIIQSIFCSVGIKPTEHSKKKYILLLQIVCFLTQTYSYILQTYSYILHGFCLTHNVRWKSGHCSQYIDWTKDVETISRGSILGMDKRSLLLSFQLGMMPTQPLFNGYRMRFPQR